MLAELLCIDCVHSSEPRTCSSRPGPRTQHARPRTGQRTAISSLRTTKDQGQGQDPWCLTIKGPRTPGIRENRSTGKRSHTKC